ncbi:MULTISPECIES: hypothetical protein [unclassified Rhizobium]|uniref:hypothetical protein n=1 Tax=unclassified Rhizobium TaxID=2613769 RepID=UPI0012E39367|nr:MULTISPECIES: hypothetical protein [unclassified Rhizobium]
MRTAGAVLLDYRHKGGNEGGFGSLSPKKEYTQRKSAPFAEYHSAPRPTVTFKRSPFSLITGLVPVIQPRDVRRVKGVFCTADAVLLDYRHKGGNEGGLTIQRPKKEYTQRKSAPFAEYQPAPRPTVTFKRSPFSLITGPVPVI